jgi:hypothetical protein
VGSARRLTASEMARVKVDEKAPSTALLVQSRPAATQRRF